MKKFYLPLFVTIALHITVVQAQQGPDLRTQATEDTRKLAQKISLDDARTPQVKRLTYERLLQENEIKQLYSIDPAMLQSKMAVIEKEYAEKLKGVLSDMQYQRYLAATTSNASPVDPVVATPAVVLPASKAPVRTAKVSILPKSKVPAGVASKKASSRAHTGTIPSHL
jgi:hypothetical protein